MQWICCWQAKVSVEIVHLSPMFWKQLVYTIICIFIHGVEFCRQTWLHNLARRQQKYNGLWGIPSLHTRFHWKSLLHIIMNLSYSYKKPPVLTINPLESAWEEGNMHFIKHLYIHCAVTPLKNLGARCIFQVYCLTIFEHMHPESQYWSACTMSIVTASLFLYLL